MLQKVFALLLLGISIFTLMAKSLSALGISSVSYMSIMLMGWIKYDMIIIKIVKDCMNILYLNWICHDAIENLSTEHYKDNTNATLSI